MYMLTTETWRRPPRRWPTTRFDEADQPQADASPLHDQSGEDEERHRQENVVPGPVHHALRERHQRGSIGHPQITRRSHQQHKPHRHAGQDGHDEEGHGGNDGIVAGEPRPARYRG